MSLLDDHDSFEYQLGKFTGSCATAVMWHKPEQLNHFALVKFGELQPDPPTWGMHAGRHMEPLIADWIERKTSPITRRGEVVDHPSIPDICVKLDGYRAADDTVLEFKFLAPIRRAEDDFLPYYYPQVLLQKLCTGASHFSLVVAQGTSDPVEYALEFEQGYTDELLRRADAFLQCLRTLTTPYPLPPVYPPEKWRTVDVFKEPTNWSGALLDHLGDYAETAEAAKAHDTAGAAARALVPDDVGRVIAGGWQIARNRKGVLSITRRNP